jgi:hypothetical protein
MAFLLMVLSGFVLYISPQGKVAHWSDWRVWGLDKEEWGDLHVTMGLLMLVAGVLHIYFNWKIILAYLRDRQRKLKIFTPELNLALLIALAVAALTLLASPPLQWILDLRQGLRDSAARELGDPPYGHAEESTLESFLRQLQLDPELSMNRLERQGIEADPEATLQDIATRNGLTPQQVYEAVLRRQPSEASPQSVLPGQAPKGLGRMTLGTLSSTYGVELSSLLAALASRGIDADPDLPLKEIAAAAETDPHQVYRWLQEERPDGADS